MNEFSIHDAAKDGDLEKVRQLIESGVPVDSLNRHGQAPLHLAAAYGDYEMAGLLINSKCNINLKCSFGRTPVMMAVRVCSKDVVDLLLHHGAQSKGVDISGQTLLHMASIHTGWSDFPGQAFIERLILDNGEAGLNAVDEDGSTPLMLAARFGNEEVAALLIQAGADVNQSDTRCKRTALHWAVADGNTRVIQMLLEKEGLSLSPQDVEGDTPLHVACKGYCREAIKQLLEAGVNISMKNNGGRTALSEGILRGNVTHKEIGLFVQKGDFLGNWDYKWITWNSFLKMNVLMDVELCTQSVVNKFNHESLPALNSIAYFARRLPNVDNFKLGARHIDEVKNLVKCEIERNYFCNVVKVHPISLGALCVLSLITCQSRLKRSASPNFGHSLLLKKIRN